MRYLYSCLLYLALPFILLRLKWKARKTPAYGERWGERFGWARSLEQPSIWVHAVSVGEAIAAVPLVQALRERYPQYKIVVTSMTPTGSAQVQRSLGDSVYHSYVPYDFSWSLKRFIKHIRPVLVVIMETELWPNLLHVCGKAKLPLLLANALLSSRSARGYRFIKKLIQPALASFTTIAAQNQADANRFLELGARQEQIIITGSIKFDLKIPEALVQQGQVLRSSWGAERPVWIAASTHQGEEEQVLAAFAAVKQQLTSALLILVPRHPERFADVGKLCRQRGFRVLCRSIGQPCLLDTDIFLGDTMGELFLYYAMADIAFVGGSLMPIGGHNMLEPAALGLPVLTGPHYFNFNQIVQLLTSAQAMQIVQNETELAARVLQLFQDHSLIRRMGEQSRAVVAANRGALAKHVEWIERQLQG